MDADHIHCELCGENHVEDLGVRKEAKRTARVRAVLDAPYTFLSFEALAKIAPTAGLYMVERNGTFVDHVRVDVSDVREADALERIDEAAEKKYHEEEGCDECGSVGGGHRRDCSARMLEMEAE